MAQNQELIKYIKEQLAKGKSKDEIRQKLRQTGWMPLDIDVAFYAVQGNSIPVSPSIAPVTTNSTKNRKKGASPFLYFLLFVALLGLMTASVMAYLRIQQPDPKLVLSQMIINFSQNKSFNYSGTLELATNLGAIAQNDNAEVTQALQFLATDKNKIAFQGTYSALQDKPQAFSVVAQANADSKPLSFEARFFAEKLYVLLDSDSKANFLDLSQIKGLWIFIPPELLTSDTATQQQLTAEQRTQMLTEIAQANIISLTPMGDEVVAGVMTYKYSYTIDQKALVVLAKKLGAIANPAKPLTFTSLENLPQQSIFGGELWIGKENKQLYKIVLQMVGKTSPEATADSSLLATIEFGRFNEELTISEPKEYIDALIALQKILVPPTGSVPSPTPSGTITPTVSITPSVTPSVTGTPSMTPSVTPTSTVPLVPL